MILENTPSTPVSTPLQTKGTHSNVDIFRYILYPLFFGLNARPGIDLVRFEYIQHWLRLEEAAGVCGRLGKNPRVPFSFKNIGVNKWVVVNRSRIKVLGLR